MNGQTINLLGDILSAAALFAVPLMLVALGGMFSERSGVINIAQEGVMVVGALLSCLVLKWSNSAGWGQTAPQGAMLLAVAVSAVSGAAYALLLAFAAVHLKADQTIGGTALNMLAPAFSVVLTWAIQGQGQTQIAIPGWIRIGGITKTSGFFERVLFKSLYLTTPIAILMLIAAVIILRKTRFGLRLMACGEHPQAADSVGINVYKMRYAGVLISGIFGGIGGLAYTIAAGSSFSSAVYGYGFLALAVMIFGNWNPVSIALAALFFALFKVVGSYAGMLAFLPSVDKIKSGSSLYQMLPYVVTMILLIFTSKRSRAPKAEGIPYDKGSR